MTRFNSLRLLAAAAAVSACFIAPSAFAADTGSLSVSASVKAVCTFSVGPMDFGQIDPSTVSTAPTANALVTYQCTKGTVNSSITLASGTSLAITDGGTNSLTVSMSIPSPVA